MDEVEPVNVYPVFHDAWEKTVPPVIEVIHPGGQICCFPPLKINAGMDLRQPIDMIDAWMKNRYDPGEA